MSDKLFGRSDFGVRFVCGAFFGGLLGFGIWISACHPTYTANQFNALAWLIAKLGLQDVIHSGWAALAVMAGSALVTGVIVGIWRFEKSL